jgi:hypothetical protein
LEVPGTKTARVIEGIKHEVRKYLKRERRKKLPEGVDYWDFDCRLGTSAESATPTHVKTISQIIYSTTEENPVSIYVEIRTKGAKRNPAAKPENAQKENLDTED